MRNDPESFTSISLDQERMIVLGAAVLEHLEQNPKSELSHTIRALLHDVLIDPAEHALFSLPKRRKAMVLPFNHGKA